MNTRKILVYDVQSRRGERIASHLAPLAGDVVPMASLGPAARAAAGDESVSIFLAVLDSLDSPAIRLLSRLKTDRPGLAVVAGVSLASPGDAAGLLEDGTVDGLASPDDPAGLFAAVRNEILKIGLRERGERAVRDLRRLKQEQARRDRRSRELEGIFEATLENLMTAMDVRDVETFGHSLTVAKYSEALAKILGWTDAARLDAVRKGALLHDIGKIAIPDAVLKKPGGLSAGEWRTIRLHPSLGYGLIKEIRLVPEVGNIILHHHERYDGSGYPEGLKAEAIPAEARIFAVADALDAITAHRPYRRPRDMKAARREIERGRGTQFDPETVDAFCSLNLDRWERIRFETTSRIPGIEDFSLLLKTVRV